MTSKAKKSRRNATKAKQKNDNSERSRYNPYMFFNGDEISQIKSALRIKDIAAVPAVVGCVILNKQDTLQKVLKHGVDINELGPNNTSALIWAVKYKHLHLVDFLLANGADPTIKTENGEDVLMTALEHKLWDENSFVSVWNQVKNGWPVDVNTTNKNGHTMLHIAVRRDWDRFAQVLIAQKADVESANSNGVTALMAACCRGGLAGAHALLAAGACASREDHHRRTALCYAVVCGGKSSPSRPPYPLADRLVRELKATGAFRDYVKV